MAFKEPRHRICYYMLPDKTIHLMKITTWASDEGCRRHMVNQLPNGSTIIDIADCKDQGNFEKEVEDAKAALEANPLHVPVNAADLAIMRAGTAAPQVAERLGAPLP